MARRNDFSNAWKKRGRIFQSLEKTAACLAVAFLLPAAPAFALGLKPVLATNEQAHLATALRYLNMTEADLAFQKDLGKPLVVSRLNRELLADPLRLMPFADRVLDVARSADPARLWALGAELLDAEPPPEPVPPKKRQRQVPPWEAMDAGIAGCITEFLADADRAGKDLDRAFARLSAEDRQYLAASVLVGMFNVEDRPEMRDELARAGVPTGMVDRVIREGWAIDPEPVATNFLALVERIRFDSLLAAGRRLQAATDRLAGCLSAVTNWPDAIVTFETPHGEIVIGTPRADVYTNEAFLVIDPGGDDTYTGRVLRANGLAGRPMGVLIELRGDDRYYSDSLVGVGAAMFGATAVFERQGDDRHEARYLGSAGALFGTAWFFDKQGDDRHAAYALSQAAAYGGFACLCDVHGDDRFDVGLCGQAFAGVRAAAILANTAGDDAYFAGGREIDHERNDDKYVSLAQGFAIGMRPFAGGGFAALVDTEGDDSYEADVYGQGVGYWYSTGMLLDRAGNDQYKVYQYGQGAGIHLACGLLADGNGFDTYTGGILVQGCAHDYAAGFLIDQNGNDIYSADHDSQGHGMNSAVGVLIDGGGADVYSAAQPETSQGVGNDGGHRECGSLGVLMDLGGADIYSCGAADGARLLRPNFGIVYDVAPGAGGPGGAP